MARYPRFRCAVPMLALALLTTGCQTAMSAQFETLKPPPETYEVPLRFARHNFGAACYNTLRCSVIYNNKEFTPFDVDKPSPAPQPNYRDNWDTAYLGVRNFPPPAEVRWTSMDGAKHEAKVDMAAIFKEQLIWHKVPKSDMAEPYQGPVEGSPGLFLANASAGIFLEVNDRTINVYMHAMISTKTEQIPGNKYSDFRDDWFLVWTHTY